MEMNFGLVGEAKVSARAVTRRDVLVKNVVRDSFPCLADVMVLNRVRPAMRELVEWVDSTALRRRTRSCCSEAREKDFVSSLRASRDDWVMLARMNAKHAIRRLCMLMRDVS